VLIVGGFSSRRRCRLDRIYEEIGHEMVPLYRRGVREDEENAVVFSLRRASKAAESISIGT
jgi:hypothetical protein